MLHDDRFPPPKKHTLKPRDFERVNPPASAAGPRVDVRDLIGRANAPAPPTPPVSPARPPSPPPAAGNDIHRMLAQNLAAARAAGEHTLAPAPPPSRRRLINYLIALLGVDGAIIGWTLFTHNWLFALCGVVLWSISLTWITWFVMGRH